MWTSFCTADTQCDSARWPGYHAVWAWSDTWLWPSISRHLTLWGEDPLTLIMGVSSLEFSDWPQICAPQLVYGSGHCALSTGVCGGWGVGVRCGMAIVERGRT